MTKTLNPITLSSSSLVGDKVTNRDGQDLGKIDEVMIDVASGRVAYAVLSFGGFLGLGDKLFAIPWSMLSIDTHNQKCVLDVTKEQLENADGFDKDNWPDFAEESFHTTTYGYWKQTPYWAS